MSRLKTWIADHDDRWSFILPYVFLSVLLSVLLSLFWLAALIVIHGVIEWKRLQPARFWRGVGTVFPRIQLDLALLIAAVAVEVYLSTTMGLAGASQAARVATVTATRSTAWAGVIRTVLLSADDCLQFLKMRKSKPKTEESPPEGIQRVPAIIAAIAVALLAVSPLILRIDLTTAVSVISSAFSPFP